MFEICLNDESLEKDLFQSVYLFGVKNTGTHNISGKHHEITCSGPGSSKHNKANQW